MRPIAQSVKRQVRSTESSHIVRNRYLKLKSNQVQIKSVFFFFSSVYMLQCPWHVGCILYHFKIFFLVIYCQVKFINRQKIPYREVMDLVSELTMFVLKQFFCYIVVREQALVVQSMQYFSIPCYIQRYNSTLRDNICNRIHFFTKMLKLPISSQLR